MDESVAARNSKRETAAEILREQRARKQVQRSFASLRCNEDQKGVPPRVEYVLEAQALKEARDDPRWRRSSPEILLHDGAGSKRQDCTGGTGDQREAGTAAVFSAVSWAGRAGVPVELMA